MLNRAFPVLATLVLVLTGFASAMAHPATAAPTQPSTFLQEVAGLAAPGLRADLPWLEPMLPSATGTSPQALVDAVGTLRAAFTDAHDASSALRAAAGLDGTPQGKVPKLPPAQSLDREILEMYGHLGLTPSPQQALELKADVLALPPAQAQGMALLVNAVNQALILQGAAAPSDLEGFDTGFDAVQGFLMALQTARGLLAPSSSSMATSCGAPFEDPLKLVWLGTPCDDVLPNDAARVLQVDPAGNDHVYDNAGGAQLAGIALGGSPVAQGSIESDRGILEIQDNVTLGPFFPLAPTNTTWQDRVIANFTTYLNQTVENLTAIPGNELAFLGEFIAGIHPIVLVNQTAARATVPVAFAVDFGGNDVYSGGDYVQGAAGVGSIGVLLDFGGDDTYTCASFCQGGSNVGLAVLYDDSGQDTYSAVGIAQAAGDGGILLDMGGNDQYSGSAFGVQGAYTNLLAPHAIPTVLFDAVGDDTYTSTGTLAQGAGAFLADFGGNDHYTNTGSLAQGAAPTASLGILLDVLGDDVYVGNELAQGASYQGPAILADLSGNDAYTTTTGQGNSIGSGYLAMLYDSAGDDVYDVGTGQGFGDGSGFGVLMDLTGDDHYTAVRGQGATGQDRAGGALGLLVDSDGTDSYTAGDHSQGSGTSAGLGFLLDVYGADTYVAGDLSQGSGGDDDGLEELIVGGVSHPHEGGLGLLMDGTQDQARARVGVDAAGETSLDVSSPPLGAMTPDSYTAGDYSQGASGSTGGIGLLLDRETKGTATSSFTAGDYSQGSATAGGIGLLANAEGKSSYVAGGFSQGASDGGLGILVDQTGDDSYAPTATTSHGYGAMNLSAPSLGLGLLLDDRGTDAHPAMSDNSCQASGEFGLAVDTVGLSVPTGCPAVIAAGLSATALDAAGQVQALLLATVDQVVAAVTALVFPAPPVPPSGTVYFYDDMESGASQWQTPTSLDGVTAWRIRNATTEPQPAPNAHTGSQYWYVGLPAGIGYTDSAGAELTSNAISLTGATNPEMHVWIGGSSETDFDFLRVSIHDVTAATTTQVLELSGGLSGGNPLPAYGEHVVDLTSYAGDSVELVFTFSADSLNPDGQGWNVDDVVVTEA